MTTRNLRCAVDPDLAAGPVTATAVQRAPDMSGLRLRLKTPPWSARIASIASWTSLSLCLAVYRLHGVGLCQQIIARLLAGVNALTSGGFWPSPGRESVCCRKLLLPGRNLLSRPRDFCRLLEAPALTS